MKKSSIFLLIIIILICTGCTTKTNLYTNAPSGYTEITSIDNLSFSIPLALSSKATAVTQILDDISYNSNDAYSFNNGSDSYILFCMNEIIIIAAKGTQFHFSQFDNKESCLSNDALINTWFQPSGKRLTYKDVTKNSIYKIIVDVTAEVVVTTELYGDYIGKLAVIESEDYEWSLFVGVVAGSNDISSRQFDVINNITQSMSIKAHPIKEEPVYEVVIDSSFKDNETSLNENNKNENEIITPNKDTVNISDPDQSSINTDKNLSHINPAYEQKQEDSLNESIKTGFNITNQKDTHRELEKAYSSDEYSMLSLGQSGLLSCINSDEHPIIRINSVYTGEAATNKIKKYVNTQSVYDYYPAPDGYSWHLIEYDISYQNCTNNPYINIKLVGLDGNQLIFRGIPISMRTHDANCNIKEKGKIKYGMWCYYAVPNGCYEYALECGDGNIDKNNSMLAAYYHIKLK